MKKIFVALVLFAIFLEVTLVPLIFTRYFRLLQPTETKYCFHNKDINTDRRSPIWSEHHKLKVDRTKAREENCITAGEALNGIASKMTDERYDKDANPEYNPSNLTMFNCQTEKEIESKGQIHFTGSHKKPGKSSSIHWKSDISTGNDVRYQDEEGTVFFQKSGQYFINIQLTIKIENKNCSASVENIVKLQVVHVPVRLDKRIVILEHVHSECQLPDKQGELSINVGAAFNLQKDDKIHAVLTPPHLLVSGYGRDHFSIHEM